MRGRVLGWLVGAIALPACLLSPFPCALPLVALLAPRTGLPRLPRIAGGFRITRYVPRHTGVTARTAVTRQLALRCLTHYSHTPACNALPYTVLHLSHACRYRRTLPHGTVHAHLQPPYGDPLPIRSTVRLCRLVPRLRSFRTYCSLRSGYHNAFYRTDYHTATFTAPYPAHPASSGSHGYTHYAIRRGTLGVDGRTARLGWFAVPLGLLPVRSTALQLVPVGIV